MPKEEAWTLVYSSIRRLLRLFSGFRSFSGRRLVYYLPCDIHLLVLFLHSLIPLGSPSSLVFLNLIASSMFDWLLLSGYHASSSIFDPSVSRYEHSAFSFLCGPLLLCYHSIALRLPILVPSLLILHISLFHLSPSPSLPLFMWIILLHPWIVSLSTHYLWLSSFARSSYSLPFSSFGGLLASFTSPTISSFSSSVCLSRLWMSGYFSCSSSRERCILSASGSDLIPSQSFVFSYLHFGCPC